MVTSRRCYLTSRSCLTSKGQGLNDRIAAGMCCSKHFLTNASEAVNMIIKSKVNYKKSDLPIFVTKLMINDQL